jgi:hypothetical protein
VALLLPLRNGLASINVCRGLEHCADLCVLGGSVSRRCAPDTTSKRAPSPASSRLCLERLLDHEPYTRVRVDALTPVRILGNRHLVPALSAPVVNSRSIDPVFPRGSAKVSRLPAALLSSLRSGEESIARNFFVDPVYPRAQDATPFTRDRRKLPSWHFCGYTLYKRSDHPHTLKTLSPSFFPSILLLPITSFHIHASPSGRPIISMPAWFGYAIQQAKIDGKVAYAILHPQTLHLLLENVFSFLCFATLCLYSHYALIAHFSIKLRGLVHNDW